jgi:hypothetical protein
MISLDAVTRLQPDQVVGPESMKKEIGGGAPRAVAGHAGFAAVGIEYANAEICVVRVGGRRYGNAVSARAVVPIANATGQIAGIINFGKLFRFENQIVISETLKLCESHIWSAAA